MFTKKYIGFTGVEYSDKDKVIKIFRHLGVPVFDGDRVLRYFIEKKGINPSDPQLIKKIKKYCLPDTMSAYYRWHERQKSKWTLFKFNYIYEFELDFIFDKMIFYSISDDKQIENGASLSDIDQQMPKFLYRLKCNYIIEENQNIFKQVIKINKIIKNEKDKKNNKQTIC